MPDLDDEAIHDADIKALVDLVSDTPEAEQIAADLLCNLIQQLPDLKDPKGSAITMINMIARSAGINVPFSRGSNGEKP